MDSFKPRRINSLRGKVMSGSFGKNTKSEHEGIFLDTIEGRYLLRRKGGPSFKDPELEKYLGQEVECDGFLMNSTLITDQIRYVN